MCQSPRLLRWPGERPPHGAAFLLSWSIMNVVVYIDGFNFYYGCLKGSPDKWLDIGAFCRASLPNDTILRIRYFTAQVKATASNPDAPVRQMVYLRALATLPNMSIHEGRFFRTTKTGKLVRPRIPGLDRATITTWEEKATDVSIATHLVADGFRGVYERAVVISNDSDLLEPIALIHAELGLPVDVLSPHASTGKPSYHLQQVASSYRAVDRALLGACQFPPRLIDAQGRVITKPVAW